MHIHYTININLKLQHVNICTLEIAFIFLYFLVQYISKYNFVYNSLLKHIFMFYFNQIFNR